MIQGVNCFPKMQYWYLLVKNHTSTRAHTCAETRVSESVYLVARSRVRTLFKVHKIEKKDKSTSYINFVLDFEFKLIFKTFIYVRWNITVSLVRLIFFSIHAIYRQHKMFTVAERGANLTKSIWTFVYTQNKRKKSFMRITTNHCTA